MFIGFSNCKSQIGPQRNLVNSTVNIVNMLAAGCRLQSASNMFQWNCKHISKCLMFVKRMIEVHLRWIITCTTLHWWAEFCKTSRGGTWKRLIHFFCLCTTTSNDQHHLLWMWTCSGPIGSIKKWLGFVLNYCVTSVTLITLITPRFCD